MQTHMWDDYGSPDEHQIVYTDARPLSSDIGIFITSDSELCANLAALVQEDPDEIALLTLTVPPGILVPS